MTEKATGGGPDETRESGNECGLAGSARASHRQRPARREDGVHSVHRKNGLGTPTTQTDCQLDP